MFRVLPLIVAAVAVVVAADASAYAADKDETHQGIVVTAGDGKLTMTDNDGKNEHMHNVGADAKISCDGKECKLNELKKGSTVKVTVTTKDGKKSVTKIEAKKPV